MVIERVNCNKRLFKKENFIIYFRYCILIALCNLELKVSYNCDKLFLIS